MRILLYGATEIGYMLAAQLSQDHDLTVIDEGTELPERFRNLDIRHVVGNGADIAALEKANEPAAALFIACSSPDEANIVACWTIKKITSLETICFVSKREVHHNLIAPDQFSYQTAYDIDTVIWPEQLLTQDILRIILVPEAIDVEYFVNGQVKLFEYRIKEDSPLCNRRIMDHHFPRDVLIVGITRDDSLFIPKGDSRILLDDKIMFMGTGQALDLLAADLFQITATTATAAIIGGGNVGFFLARQLERAGIRVKIIEHDQQRCMYLADNLNSTLVLHGDGTDIELLEEEDIGALDVAVCVTDNDEKNLLCSLMVKQLGLKRVITRVSGLRKAQLFERVGIDVVVSPRESAMKELLNHLEAKDIDILALVGGGRAEVMRLQVAETFATKRIMDIGLPKGAIVGVVKRGKGIIIPHGDTVIRPLDRLKIFTLPENIDRLRSLFTR